MTLYRQADVFFHYTCEGMALLGEGVPAAAVEDAAREMGFPLGPLAALDRLSLKPMDHALHQELHELERVSAAGQDEQHQEHGHDHACSHGHDHDHADSHDHGHEHGRHDADTKKAKSHVHKVKSQRMPESAVYVLEKMAHGYKRLGQRGGAGFYDYTDGAAGELWTGLKTFERGGRGVPALDIRDRLAYAAALAASRSHGQEKLAITASEEEMIAAGFEMLANHAARLIEQVGQQRLAERAQELASQYGTRFEPTAQPNSAVSATKSA